MECYALYSHPYCSSAWQLLCTETPVAASSQVTTDVLFSGFFLGSHWKLLFVLNIHLQCPWCVTTVFLANLRVPGVIVLVGKAFLSRHIMTLRSSYRLTYAAIKTFCNYFPSLILTNEASLLPSCLRLATKVFMHYRGILQLALYTLPWYFATCTVYITMEFCNLHCIELHFPLYAC